MQAWESHVSQLTTLLGCAPDLLREQLLYVDWSEHVAPVLLPNQWALIADAIQSTHGITFDNCWVEVLNQDTLLVCLGECWYYSKTLNCYADNDTNFFLEAELSLSKQNLGPNCTYIKRGLTLFHLLQTQIYVFNVPKKFGTETWWTLPQKQRHFLKGLRVVTWVQNRPHQSI